MNTEGLQNWIDGLRSASRQHWCLQGVVIVAPLAAFGATDVAIGSFSLAGLVLVTLLSLFSALQPDSHLGIAVIAVICWHWLATVDDVRTPWVLAVGIALLVFHSATSLLSIAPAPAVHPAATLVRYLRRNAIVAAATVGVWGVVVAFDARNARGNALLTLAALAALAAATLALRARSMSNR